LIREDGKLVYEYEIPYFINGSKARLFRIGLMAVDKNNIGSLEVYKGNSIKKKYEDSDNEFSDLTILSYNVG
jgi:hypothetical protein